MMHTPIVPEKDLFGDLRSLVHSRPDAANWKLLCRLLDRFSTEDMSERILPYVIGHMRRWDECVRVAPHTWLDALFRGAKVPALSIVATLDLHGRRPVEDTGMQIVAKTHAFKNLRRMMLSRQHIGPMGIQALTHSAITSLVHTLDLSANRLHGAAIQTLCHTHTLPKLTHLNVHHNQLDGRDVACLVQSELGARLRALDLSGNEGCSPVGLEAIAHLEHEMALEELYLNTCSMRWLGAKALGDAAIKLPKLHTLSMTHNALTHDTITAIFRFVHWQSLKSLTLHSNWLGATGVKILASAKGLDQLKHLAMGNNSIGAAGLDSLSMLPSLSMLQRLELPSNDLRNEGLRRLVAMPELEHLEMLDLSRNGLGSQAALMIGQSMWPAGMRDLNLQHNKIGDDGLHHLLSRNAWPSLERLVLRLCGLTNKSAFLLANFDGLPALRHLELDFNNIGLDGAKALAHSPHLHESVRSFWQDRMG